MIQKLRACKVEAFRRADEQFGQEQALYCWVNGTSFNFSDSREIARRNAEALWKHCIFDIKR